MLQGNKLEEIERLGERAVVPLALFRGKYTSDEDVAARALARIRDPEAVESLAWVLEDAGGQCKEGMRIAAAMALGDIATGRAVDALVGQLGGSSDAVRIEVIQALGRAGDRRAVAPLLACLDDDSNFIRRPAALALALLGDSRAVEPLSRVIADQDRVVGYGRQEYKLAAESALARLDQSTAERYVAVLRDEATPAPEKRHALEMVAMAGRRQDAELVIDVLLRHPDAHDRYMTPLRKLFDNYDEIIHGLADCYSGSAKTTGREWEEVTTYTYELRTPGLERLCALRTALADNLLHKATCRPDLEVVGEVMDQAGTSTRVLSLEPLREMARQELLRRGSPAYRPEVFLDDAAWTLALAMPPASEAPVLP